MPSSDSLTEPVAAAAGANGRSPSRRPDATGHEFIQIHGAREHNLKDISLKIPRGQLVVLTGISGSGKSSLAFDTLFAEGQRRYMESFSSYARGFIGEMARPNVDKVEGLSPVISIEQKTVSRNPRSTVGTTTEVYDFLRLLYARASEAFSYETGERMIKQTEDQIIDTILAQYEGKRLSILAPIVKGRKGHYREDFVRIARMGYTRVRVDGVIEEIRPKMQLDRYKKHDIEIVIDRVVPAAADRVRLARSVQTALQQGKGVMMTLEEGEGAVARHFSRFLMCPTTGISYDEPAPNNFSFNTPYGACPTCNGLGLIEEIDEALLMPDPALPITAGGLAPLGEYRDIWVFHKLAALLKGHKLTMSKPVGDLPRAVIDEILYGAPDKTLKVHSERYQMPYNTEWEGLVTYLRTMLETGSDKMRQSAEEFIRAKACPECGGARLKRESLHFKIDGRSISELAHMPLQDLETWIGRLEGRLSARQRMIAHEVLKEIGKRLRFLNEVGLDYLDLDRPMQTLSGGEAQRIRLATQIGTQLTGVLYILDEPSIGLHQRDNVRLIRALQRLRDLGNSVLVVEHDKDMMLAADYLIDVGPGAGRHGGQIVGAGTVEVFTAGDTPTARYLRGQVQLQLPDQRRGGTGERLRLVGATGHNLQNVSLDLPLGTLTVIAGVSGSGKSTLIHETLYPLLANHFYRSRREVLPYQSLEGIEQLDKVIEVDQSPIGRTPRSNPATYTGVFSEIRNLFAQLPEAKLRGYKPGRFSFNVKGGRCEECEGGGLRTIAMDFLPDVYVECQACRGRRYNRETLEVRYKGKSIADVLSMTVEQAVDFFAPHPTIQRKIATLLQVGLGYLTLGQQATTLSGGEAQRVKLATELSKKDTGRTMYILDEPTTGLHFQDIEHLMGVLSVLVDRGNTVLIIEHNLDVMRLADHVIDMGPEGGRGGGRIVAEGTPEAVAIRGEGPTAPFLFADLGPERLERWRTAPPQLLPPPRRRGSTGLPLPEDTYLEDVDGEGNGQEAQGGKSSKTKAAKAPRKPRALTKSEADLAATLEREGVTLELESDKARKRAPKEVAKGTTVKARHAPAAKIAPTKSTKKGKKS